MSKKIIKFKRDADTYFDLAEEKLDGGDYESALYYFFCAHKLLNNIDTLMAVGETYCEMGEMEEGLKYLFAALDKDPKNDDICQSISACFSYMGEEETAFFYFQPGMSVKKFKSLIKGDWINPQPKIRPLEDNDGVIISVAAKLLLSGDVTYATDMLLSVRQRSKYYASARNILALSALDDEKIEEALAFCNDAIESKDSAEMRSTRVIALYLLDRKDEMQQDINFIEAQRLDLDGHRSAAMAYIRIDNAPLAARHLKFLLDAKVYNRDYMLSYALAVYNTGDTDKAKSQIIKASRVYPEDIAIKEIAGLMASGEKLAMYPLLPQEMTKSWFDEINSGLNLMQESGDSLLDSDDYKKRIDWLFQTNYGVRQSRIGLALCKTPAWHDYLKKLLLDNYLDLPTKKILLYGLLRYGNHKKLGIVLDGLYSKLKISYPICDQYFRAGYCLAFAALTFADAGFEKKLLTHAERLIEKYNSRPDKSIEFKSEEAIGAILFFVASKNKSIKASHCAHIFDCEESVMKQYMKVLGVKP